jgi:ferrochelatase
MKVAFQSPFGPEEWLKPYLDQTIQELTESGVKKVAVVCPGFAADCVETLEEIAIGIQEEFLEAGGTHFAAIPCLNQSAGGIDLLESLARRELQGWVAAPHRAQTVTPVRAAQDAAD